MIKRFLVGFGLVFVVGMSYASVSHKQAVKILQNLVKQNHITYVHHLKVVPDKDMNAWVHFGSDTVYITQGILDAGTTDEIALVLGHEVGHLGYGASEDRADWVGTSYTENAGYNACAGRNMFKKFLKKYGDPPKDDVHSPNMVRYNNIGIWASCNP